MQFPYRLNRVSPFILASTLALTIASCGSGGGDGDEKPKSNSSATSSFDFAVEIPNFTAPRGELNSDSGSSAELAFQVAIVDFQGRITQIVDAISIEPYGDGSTPYYTITLPGGERVDCVIIVELGDQPDLQVGDYLDPQNYLYAPTTDSEQESRINPTSSVAFDLFIDSVDDFNGVDPDELDAILENAQDLVDAGSSASSSISALIDSIADTVSSNVLAEVLFADASPNSPNGSASTGNYESDKAAIKGFFDDLNAFKIIADSLSNDTDTGPLDEFENHMSDARDYLVYAESSMATMGFIQDGLNNWKRNLPTPYPSVTQNVPIATVFTGDPKAAGLSGTVSYNDEGMTGNVSGTYDAAGTNPIIITNLMVGLDFTATDSDAELTFSGTLESEEAVLLVRSGTLNTDTTELNSVFIANPSDDNTAFLDSLAMTDIDLDLQLTAKALDPADDAVFDGTLTAEAIRSANDFIDLDLIDNGSGAPFTSDPEPYFNVETANFDGIFTAFGDSIDLVIAMESETAGTYVPGPIKLLQGLIYDSLTIDGEPLATYSWNGTDRYEVKYPGGSEVREKVTRVDQPTNTITYCDGCSGNTYLSSFDSFEDYLIEDNWAYINGGYQQGFLEVYTYINSGDVDSSITYTIDLTTLANGSNLTVNANYAYQYDYGLTPANPPTTIPITYSYTADTLDMASVDPYFEYYREYQTGVASFDAIKITSYYGEGASYSYYDNYGFYNPIYTFIEGLNDSWDTTYFDVEGYGFFCVGLTPYYIQDNCNTLAGQTSDFSFGTLVTGDDLNAPVYLQSQERLKESESNYRDLDGTITLTLKFDGLGETEIEITQNQTGYGDGIQTLSIKNVENLALTSQVSLTAFMVDEEILDVAVTNERGFSITEGDVTEVDDGFDYYDVITFGAATAIVEDTDLGLKVSYPHPNGSTTFDLY